MRDYQIKVEPFTYVALQDMEIHKGLNCHADAKITMRIRDDKREEYLGVLSADTWIKVTAQGEGGMNTDLFCGIEGRDEYRSFLRHCDGLFHGTGWL